MTGLKIIPIDLSKEAWENVPGVVYKSFTIFSQNLTSIKKWSERNEESMKQAAEHREELDLRLNDTDALLQATKEQIDSVDDELQNLLTQSDKEFLTFTSCTRQLLEATLLFFEHFVIAFNPHPQGDLPTHESHKEMGYKDGDHADELESLNCLCGHLGGHLEHIDKAFDVWTNWRGNLKGNNDFMMGKVEELRGMSEKTRERLLAWREILKESRYEVDSLNESLEQVQRQVKQIQEEKLNSFDVNEIVGGSALELRECIAHAESVADRVKVSLDHHVNQVTTDLQTIEDNVKNQLEAHDIDTKLMFEQKVNPISAYMNTMHVKAETVRFELNGLLTQVPNLEMSIKDVSAQLQKHGAQSQAARTVLSNRLDDFSNASLASFESSDAERERLSNQLHAHCQELGAHLAQLQNLQDSTSQTIDHVRHVEQTKITNELISLEQKVAKWVHAGAMPAKVNEARLYSLEAKLAEEMESRFEFEESISRTSLPQSRDSRSRLPASRDSKGFNASGGFYSARAPASRENLPSLAGSDRAINQPLDARASFMGRSA